MKKSKADLIAEAADAGVSIDPDTPYAIVLHEVKQLRANPPRVKKTPGFNSLAAFVWSEDE
jgi:hypothetical protein